jgi:hypothetical protein
MAKIPQPPPDVARHRGFSVDVPREIGRMSAEVDCATTQGASFRFLFLLRENKTA